MEIQRIIEDGKDPSCASAPQPRIPSADLESKSSAIFPHIMRLRDAKSLSQRVTVTG